MDAKSRVAALKERLEQRLQNSNQSRVGEEMHNLFGNIHARTIFRPLGRVALEVALITAICGMLLHFMSRFISFETCVMHSFYGGIGERCLSDPVVLVFFGLCAVVVSAASIISTVLKKERRFQHSALVTVFIFFVIAFYAGQVDWSWSVMTALIIISFFLMYAGYRLGLKIRP